MTINTIKPAAMKDYEHFSLYLVIISAKLQYFTEFTLPGYGKADITETKFLYIRKAINCLRRGNEDRTYRVYVK